MKYYCVNGTDRAGKLVGVGAAAKSTAGAVSIFHRHFPGGSPSTYAVRALDALSFGKDRPVPRGRRR